MDAPRDARPKKSLPIALPAQRGRPLLDDVRPIDQQWNPSYAVWEITLQCDLACNHCGSRAARARPDELTTAECLDLVDQMAALGVNEVTIIGGEAYLRDDWTQIIERITKHKMRCAMATGGRALTRERVLDAKRAGMSAISVSVDGLEASHDLQRGVRGAFDAAMRAMDEVRSAGLRLTANTQINRHSLPELEAIFDAVVARGAKAWQVQLTAAMGRAADDASILLDPWQVLEVHPRLALLARECQRRNVLFWPGNNIGYFGSFEPVLRGHFKAGFRGSCGAGRLSLGIEANGDIKGCPSLPSDAYVGGNVRERSLEDIWRRSAALRFTRDMTSADLSGFCASCYYANECRGGCHWTAHVLRGFRGDNPYCHHRATELMKQGVREVVRLKTAAPGLPFDHAVYDVVREEFPADERERIERLTREAEAIVYASPSA